MLTKTVVMFENVFRRGEFVSFKIQINQIRVVCPLREYGDISIQKLTEIPPRYWRSHSGAAIRILSVRALRRL